MQGGKELCWRPTPSGGALQSFEFSAPFCLGENRSYFKQCDLFCSFHATVEVQFGGLAQLDRAVHNYKDNLNSLNRHPDLLLNLDKALRNMIVSAYAHYIDSWPMNGACLGHCAILMRNMLQFVMHYGHYRHRHRNLIYQCRRRRGTPLPLPAIDIATLLKDREEDLRTKQINVTHSSVMELLGDPGSPLYAEPHSMAEHFNALVAGAHAIGDLPSHGRCSDNNTTVRVHEEEAAQVRQKILRCLDMRVIDGDLVVPMCLRTPTLILLVGRFMQLYNNPDNQGQYTSQFPVDGQGFLQPR